MHLPDNLREVKAGTVDELWRHSTESINLRLDAFQRNLQYLNANKHASGMIQYADSGRYKYVKNPSRELWLYVNLLRSNLRLLVDALSSRVPQFRPIEGKADDYTISAGRLAKELLQAKYSESWQMLRQRALWYAYAAGCVGIWVDWDEQQQTTVETMTTLSDMRFEPGSKLAETARWGIKQQILPSGLVRTMFPEAFPDKDPAPDRKDRSFANVAVYSRDTSSGRTDEYTSTVRTLYVKPSSVHPEGGYFTTVGDTLVEAGPWPYPFRNHLNVAVLRQEPYEDRWVGSTRLDDCTPLQAYINQVWSYLLTLARDTGAPLLVIPGDMASQASEIDGTPGKKVFRRAGTTVNEGPYYLNPPPWPGGVYDLMDRARAALDDMLDVQDVMRGRNAPNIESGAGVVALQQAAIGGVNGMSRNEAICLGRVADMTIKMHAQRVTEPRGWLTSPEGVASSRTWTGADLQAVSGIEVPVASLDPGLKEFMTQVVIQMINAGRPGFDLTTLAKVEHLDTLDQLVEEIDPHSAYAVKENEQFFGLNDMFERLGENPDPKMLEELQSMVHPPVDSDDHETHIPIHRVMKSSAAWRQLHPALQEAFDAHLQTHQREVMIKLENMQMMRQASMAPQMGPQDAMMAQEPAL